MYPHQLAFSISATTRARRDHEVDKEHYYFLTETEFKAKIEDDLFLEWEEVYKGQFYGTLKSEINRIHAQNKTPIFDVDVVGALDIKEIYPDALSVFIRPPSVDIIRERLLKRKTESPEKIKIRLDKAEQELGFSHKFDYILVNDLLDVALKEGELLTESYLGINEEE
ncbi:UNVERIFIED_CONTAM: hypothetical protein GTU68_056512 [Idotea baltica]|nr:hypothetical protein [Idotea baltica]